MSGSGGGAKPAAAAAAAAASELHPDIMVQYLRSLGVTAETTRAIRDEVERKRAADREELERKKDALEDLDEDGDDEGVREFARRQGVDAAGGAYDGDSVMVWGILEGQPAKVEHAYGALMDFVNSSWELYRAELEAVTFPVFIHCYLTLVKFDHTDQAKALMRAWGGEHEARYKDEVTLLRMVTAKEHISVSEYAQLVLKHKFRVRMCLASSKLLNAFLVNMGLLVVMHILNTRVMLMLEDRAPLPSVQVVRCGPDDSFPATLRRGLEEKKPAVDVKSKYGNKGVGGGRGVGRAQAMKWAAGPQMEVALVKQTEPEAVASGLYYPLSLKPRVPSHTDPTSPPTSSVKPESSTAAATTTNATTTTTTTPPPTTAASTAVPATTTSAAGGAGANGSVFATPGAVGATANAQTDGTASPPPPGPRCCGSWGGGGGGRGGATVVPTGSVAAAAARARASRVAAAGEITDATARRYGGLRQKQIKLPHKPPPLPDPSDNWCHLRLTLRPLDSRLLKDTLATAEGGARPFVANPLAPHVVMLTFFNALDTLCCLKPSRDGMQVAAGFTDRVVRAWRTAPNAPYPPAADDKTPTPAATAAATVGVVQQGGVGGDNSATSKNRNPAGGAVGNGSITDGGTMGMKKSLAVGGDSAGGEGGGGGDHQPVRFVGHSQPVYGVSWSPDGRFLLSGGGDGEVRMWDMARGRTGNAAGYVRYDGHCGPVWDVAFGPLGYYFATASADRTACLWSTDCAQPLRIFAGHLKGVLCVAFHPNGNYVVTGSMDKTVRVWDVQTGNCLRLLAGHSGSVTCLSVSPNGRQIAAGSADKDIRVWDIASGKGVALLKGHTEEIECLDFSAEGSALVSGGNDNNVMIWDVASACSAGGRNGTDSSASLAVSNGKAGGEPDSASRSLSAAAAAADKIAGTKRKRGELWSSRGDGPSHGPVHTFGTRNTGVYSVMFTKRNLVIASGVCRGKT